MIPRHLLIMLALLLIAIFGMGFYALHLRNVTVANQQHVADSQPVAPPVSGPPQRVTLFVADDTDGSLNKREISIALPQERGQRAHEILHHLLQVYQERSSPHPLAEGADVKDVFLVNNTTAVVDTTAAFANGHPPGIMVEELTLASIAQTLTANFPGITQIKVLVDGRERETLAGHVDLMEFYATASAAKYVR